MLLVMGRHGLDGVTTTWAEGEGEGEAEQNAAAVVVPELPHTKNDG